MLLFALALSLSHESHRLHPSSLYQSSVFLLIDLSISLPPSTRACSRSALSCLSLSLYLLSRLSLSLSLSCSLCISRAISLSVYVSFVSVSVSLTTPFPLSLLTFVRSCIPVGFLFVRCSSMWVWLHRRQLIDHLPATGSGDGLDQRTQRQQRRE